MYEIMENQLLTYTSNVISGIKVNLAASANDYVQLCTLYVDVACLCVAQNWRAIVILLSDPSLVPTMCRIKTQN
jgi:hypothetical protein